MQGLSGQGHVWLAEQASCDIDNPFINETAIDDWLSPVFNAEEEAGFHAMLPLGCSGEEALTDSHSPYIPDELDNFFEQVPQRNSAAMRGSFSMNDLQSLQAPPMWNRSVSVKPSLESVPECGPAQPASPVSLMPISNLIHQGNHFQAASLFHEGALVEDNRVVQTNLPHEQPRQYGGQMIPGAHARAVPPIRNIAAGLGAPTMLPPLSGMEMRPPPHPPGHLGMQHESPEEHMTDAMKQEPGCDTDSSGQTAYQQPQTSGMRKSHSALELGAWRKMAAGDLDFVDPSGRVREQLQGLEICYQVGRLTPEERLQKILRYRGKRQMRNFNRTVKYQCRKSLADTRPRVRGRFARDNEPGSVMPHETKKAIREKGGKGKPAQPSTTPEEQQQQQPAQQQQQQQQGVKVDAGSSQLLPEAQGMPAGIGPGFAANGNDDANMVCAAPEGQVAGKTENQATSLAHLYNQWSEGGAAPQQEAEGTAAGMTSSGGSA